MADDAMSIKSSEYYAMGKYIAMQCHKYREAFIACKNSYDHPEDCVKEGQALLTCTGDLYQRLKKEAPEQFKGYADCLDYNGLRLNRCRDKQKELEAAVQL